MILARMLIEDSGTRRRQKPGIHNGGVNLQSLPL